jgi:phenylpropionate dioxygenase-like ring-hydroxylating dioxygenase large terminal subunit
VFLKNAWYVAAQDHEVTRALLATRILGESIVLYRTVGGAPVALEDACPHRKLPLSMGRLKGDELECGYHGLVFNCEGQCTRVPGATRIPPAAKVRSYPTLSRYGLVWIWMGDPVLADPDRVFPVDHWGEPGWARNQGGSMTVACNYLFVTDNLLDPSHVAWVHQSSFGSPDCEEEPVTATSTGSGVVASRWMLDVEVAPFYAPVIPLKGRCDRLQHYEVRFPSHAIIRAIFVPAGSGGADKPAHPDAVVMDSYNFMTPVDAEHTRYYWFQMRNFAPEDDRISTALDESVRAAFAEDRVILEAVDRGHRQRTTRNIDLAIDRAPLMYRQRLTQLITAEQPPASASV